MKNIKNLLYLLSFIALILSINACNENPVPIGNSNDYTEEFAPAELPVIDDFMGDLKGLELNSDFYIIYQDENSFDSKNTEIQCGDKDKDKDGHEGDDDGDDENDYDGDDNDHHRNGCKNGINPLGKILNKLGLSKEQRKQIYDFRDDYHDCLKYAKKQIRNRQKEIIENANDEKRNIKKQYKNGEITKEEAETLLDQLQEQLRNKLKNCVQDEIIDCVCEYLNNILSVLNETQAQTFIDFITTEHPEFSTCFNDTPPPPPGDNA